jgi:hypothetical protein
VAGHVVLVRPIPSQLTVPSARLPHSAPFPSPGVALLSHAHNPPFLALRNSGLGHRSSHAFRKTHTDSVSNFRVYCIASATWGSVPRGARKWNRKKKCNHHGSGASIHHGAYLHYICCACAFVRRVTLLFPHHPRFYYPSLNSTLPPYASHSPYFHVVQLSTSLR